MKFKLKDIKPNPFRNIDRYPINPERISALKESIRNSGYWDNILARAPNGEAEIAYGHHRLAALKEEFGPSKEIDLIVKPLDDETMLKVMANENMEEWSASALVEQETIRAAVQAYADGKIALPPVPKNANTGIRAAPGFLQENGRGARPDRLYTSSTVAHFLGWGEDKVKRILKALETIEEGTLSQEDYSGLSKEEAEVVTTEASKAKRRGGEKAARSVGRTLARKFREGKISTRGAAEEAVRVLGKTRKEERGPPEINDKARSLILALNKTLSRMSDDNAKALEEIIKYREHLKIVTGTFLVRALNGLSLRAKKYADQLGGRGIEKRR